MFAALLLVSPAFSQPADWVVTQLNVTSPVGRPAIDIVVDDSNGVHLAIGHNNESSATTVSYWYRSRPAEPWLKEVVDEGDSWVPKIMLDESGVPHIFYIKEWNYTNQQLMHAVRDTAGWNIELVADSAKKHFEIQSNGHGQPTVMYMTQYRDSNNAWHYEYWFSYLASGVWETELAYTDLEPAKIGYAVDSQNRVHVALTPILVQDGVKYGMRTDQGWSWEEELLGDTRFANVAVDTDSQDRPYVWGVGGGSFSPSYLFRRDESGWTSERMGYTTYPITQPGRLFLLDGTDQEHFAFIANHGLRYALRESEVWPSPTYLGSADYSLSLGLTPRGAPIVAFWRNSSYGVPPTDFFLAELITNTPPVASAGPDQVEQATSADGSAYVTLDASGSTDDDGDDLLYDWSESGVTIATGKIATVQLSLGIHEITLIVDDGQETATDEVTITVEATVNGLDRLVTDFVQSGDVPPNIGDRFLADLAKAAKYVEQGRYDMAIESLNEFKQNVDKKRDKGAITQDAGATLIGSADAVIGELSQGPM